MAAVIVHSDSAANAVPDDASIPPNSPLYIKVTVYVTAEIEALRRNTTTSNMLKICFLLGQKIIL